MIRVTGDRVLVALPSTPTEIVTAGGLFVPVDPDTAKKPTRGIVMALGTKSNTVDLDAARREVHTYLYDLHRSGELLSVSRIDDAIDRRLMTMGPAPFDVAIGDCVLFPLSAGDEIHADGVDYVILREADIIGVLSELTTETEAA